HWSEVVQLQSFYFGSCKAIGLRMKQRQNQSAILNHLFNPAVSRLPGCRIQFRSSPVNELIQLRCSTNVSVDSTVSVKQIMNKCVSIRIIRIETHQHEIRFFAITMHIVFGFMIQNTNGESLLSNIVE